jgi:F-type H+-transporting ATPase subunit epsilon
MVQESKTFQVVIDTPDGQVIEADYSAAKVPALDGYMGILPGRSPVAAVVTTGMITLQPTRGEAAELFVSRGFLQVHDDRVHILAEECKPLEQLDAERAWDLLQQAYKLPRETPEQRTARDEAIHAARLRFSLAQRGREGMMNLDEMLSRGLDE